MKCGYSLANPAGPIKSIAGILFFHFGCIAQWYSVYFSEKRFINHGPSGQCLLITLMKWTGMDVYILFHLIYYNPSKNLVQLWPALLQLLF